MEQDSSVESFNVEIEVPSGMNIEAIILEITRDVLGELADTPQLTTLTGERRVLLQMLSPDEVAQIRNYAVPRRIKVFAYESRNA